MTKRLFLLPLLIVPTLVFSETVPQGEPSEIASLEGDAYRLSFRQDGKCGVFGRADGRWDSLAHLRAPVLPGQTEEVSYRVFDPKAQKELFRNVNVAGIAGATGIREFDRPTVTLAAIGADGSPLALLRWTQFAKAAKLDLFSLMPREQLGTVVIPFSLAGTLSEKQVFSPVRTIRTNGEPEQETRAMAVWHGADNNGFLAATSAGLPSFEVDGEWRLPLSKRIRPWQPDRWHSSFVLSFRADSRHARMEAEALASDEPLVADSRAGDAFFLVEEPGPVSVRTTVYNAFRSDKDVRVEYRIFDADGRRVAEGTQQTAAPAFGFAEVEFPVVLREPGPHWAEVHASHPYGADWQRICFGAQKPVSFANDSGSRMGIAAFRGTAGTAHPEARADAELLGLMKRIGVRYLRQHFGCSEQARQMGFTLWFHNQPGGIDWNRYWKGEKTWMDDDALRRDWLRSNLQTTKDLGAEAFEFSNEWNLPGGEENAVRAERYVTAWLPLLREARDTEFPEIRLGGCVIANADLPYLKVVYENGGWPMFDDLVFHMSGIPRPADNPGPEYWNVLRTLRDIKAVARKYGEKPLYLSEFYAPTAPNILTSNNERSSAVDLVLQIALAVAADVKGMMYYCLDDFDRILPIQTAQQLGEPTFRENYFGLLRRDWVPKATLWAFATAAEQLDGATFLGDVELPDTRKSFGLLFQTPRGPVAILWSRIDGYPQHEWSRTHAAHQAPWVSMVDRTETVFLKADSVQVSDAFGRTRTVKGENGTVSLELSSEPVFVFGADLSPVIGHFSKMLK